MAFVCLAIMVSTFMGSHISTLKFGYSIYFAAFFQFLVFVLVRWYISKADAKNPNSQIRRIMIGSMLRMFVVLIFLVITMLNQGKANVPWTTAYVVFFLLYLFLDMSEKRTNLRPDLKTSENNANG
jgi:hypothetical protein